MRARPILLLSALTFACAGPTVDPDPSDGPAIRSVAAVKVLDAGTLVQVLPVKVIRVTDAQVSGQSGRIERSVIDGLLREALRLSPWLDFASGFEDCDAALRIVVAVDARAKQLTTSLRSDGTATLPLATVNFRDQPLDRAIDSLALEIRQALGEEVRQTPAAVGKIYSRNPDCVRRTEMALQKLAQNDRRSAVSLWKAARRSDPGCTVTLCELARIDLQEDRAKEASADVQKTLKHLEARTSPTTQHRLARIFYMARAAQSSARGAREWDQKLLELGETGMRERPYDKHALYTRALALNYLGRFDASAPLLRELAVRWPKQSWVAYHLAFANLALGQYEAALEIIETSNRRLSGTSSFMPRALSLYHCGKYAELRQQLERLADSPAIQRATAEHSLLRMRASLEILTDHRAEAARFLLDDLDWLRQRPSMCERFALDLVDTGEVLIRLGYHRDLGTRISALSELGVVSPTFSQALTYLGARVLVSESEIMPTEAIRVLEQQQQHLWSLLLKAAVYRRRGELLAETQQLSSAIQQTDNALVRASLARALATMGKSQQSTDLLTDLRGRLLKIDLRRRLRHPLLDPAHALAFLATESL